MEALFLDQLVGGVCRVLTKLNSPSLMREAPRVSRSKPGMAVAWEARGKVARTKWRPSSSIN